jgi:hypothetical protein
MGAALLSPSSASATDTSLHSLPSPIIPRPCSFFSPWLDVWLTLLPLQHIVPIAVAQNRTQPYVESNYTMQSFAQCAFLSFSLFFADLPQ